MPPTTPIPSPAPVTPTGAAALAQLGAAPGATPADPGNPNAPANGTPTLPQSGNVQTDSSTGLQTITFAVNGKLIELTLNTNINPNQPVGRLGGLLQGDTVQQALNSMGTGGSGGNGWYGDTTQRQKYIDEMYSAGLISSKKAPSVAEVAQAWQLVVQEAALQTADPTSDTGMRTPDDVLAKAAQQGWNNIGAKQAPGDVQVNGTGNINNSADTSSQSDTVYKSYVDPATAMGTLADSYFRLMGRNPTPSEYNAFMTSLYGYQDEVNTGTDKTTTKGPDTGATDPNTGLPVDQSGTTGGTSTQTNVVSQRGIAQRGIQFLAGQQALQSPEEGAYQAATTYFNAFIKALAGPASGMEASGPTTTVP